MDYTAFDYTVFALVGGLAVLGALRGFVAEAIALGAWVAAVFAVRLFHEPATAFFTPIAGGPGRGAVMAFLALFLGTLLLGRILAAASGILTTNPLVGPVDRILGLGLGAAKGLIGASALYLVANFATHVFNDERSQPGWIARSQTTPILAVTSRALVDWVKVAGGQPAPAAKAAEGQGGYSRTDRDQLEDLAR